MFAWWIRILKRTIATQWRESTNKRLWIYGCYYYYYFFCEIAGHFCVQWILGIKKNWKKNVRNKLNVAHVIIISAEYRVHILFAFEKNVIIPLNVAFLPKRSIFAIYPSAITCIWKKENRLKEIDERETAEANKIYVHNIKVS